MSSNYDFDVLSPCIGFFCTPTRSLCVDVMVRQLTAVRFSGCVNHAYRPNTPFINRDITPTHMKSLDIPALPPCLLLVLPTIRGTRLENLCLKECRFQCASAVRCASWWSPKFWAMTSAGGSSCVTTTSTIRQRATARTNRRNHLTLSSLRLQSTVN